MIPWIKAEDELGWFHDANGDVANGKIAKAYGLTGSFLRDQGRVSTVSTSQQIAASLDSSYVEKALTDKCASSS